MMEWIPKGLPNIHAPVPVCGKREEAVHTLGEGVLRMETLIGGPGMRTSCVPFDLLAM